MPTRPESPPTVALEQLVAWSGARLLGPAGSEPGAEAQGTAPVIVSGLTLNSRAVQPGDLYVAPAGASTHGARFAADAVAAGAVAVLTDEAGSQIAEVDVPVLVTERPRAVVGALAARLYGRPAEAIRMLAVTGTQGKTTTTRLAEGALQAAGHRGAAIGTVGTRVNGLEVKTALTTPEAPELHALFAMMRERGVEACAMEVSSHALVMGRVDGVVFDVAVFTNLGRDHLDFHTDIEDYFAAKASLFTPERARLGLVNIDDAFGRRLVEEATIPIRTFSLRGPADWTATDVTETATGSRFTVHGPGVSHPAEVLLPGDFNVANALAALGGLVECGFELGPLADALVGVSGVPGRLEVVDAGQKFLAVVDYAHKPDAVEAMLRSLRARTEGRLLVVLGAGGDRDRGKRPLMGEVAARMADVLVVTDDNPRTEAADAIRAEVLAGAASLSEEGRAEVHEVGDRRAAIRLAVSMAAPGDTLVVAGKGHETGQEVGGTIHPFDDRVELREALRG